MKKSKEERFYMFLVSTLSVELAGILIFLSMMIGGIHKEQKEAKDAYPDDLDSYSSYDDLQEDDKQVIKDLESECTVLLNQEEYILEKNNGIENYYVLSAVMENEYFNAYEKEEAYKLYEIIKDNPYMNKEEVYARLKTVKIERKEDSKREDTKKILQNDKTYIVASYFVNLNKIVFYDYKNIDKNTIIHELIHVLFPCKNLPRCFSEGFAELLNIEYFGGEKENDEGEVYLQEVAYVKLLCELIGSDKVLQIASTDDKEMLEEELTSCFEDKQAVKRWLNVDNIDEENLFTYFNDLGSVIDKKNYSEEKQLRILDLYYQLLFGKENDRENHYFHIERPKEKVKALN